MTNPNGQAQPIFHAALALPEAQRSIYLDAACQGDTQLRNEVDSLMIAYAEAEDFMESPAVPSQLADLPVKDLSSETVDRYKLLQQIGEGGFGVVYMAEQLKPVRRRVALKIIKAGMDTKRVIARFEAERQALALMDHANIAKVFDAGATETGRPYFVMELVHGVPVTQYCDDRSLTTDDRLVLFVQICWAIQHAHQKGVIHRDIKPSNILVSTDGNRPVPKIIDFGIAKATQGRLTDKTLFTEFHQFIGTPAYMSPEQAQMSASDVDTRSDIYSLGVLLYELLTGKPTFDAKELLSIGFDEVCRQIREREALAPSKRISSLQHEELKTLASNHRVTPTHLATVIRGDLDWIAMKAIDKDRSRRYATAEALADDIQRHLSREPVLAVPPSAAYLLRRFARRNRGLLVAVGVIATFLILGCVISTWQAIRATQAERTIKGNLYVAELANAKSEFDLLNTQAAVDLINRYVPKAGETDFRGFEWRWLWNQCNQERFKLVGHTAKLRGLRFSSDGKWLATAAKDGTARLWRMDSREQVWEFKGGSHCNHVNFSPDDRQLVTEFWVAERDREKAYRRILWDISDPMQPKEIRRHQFDGSTDFGWATGDSTKTEKLIVIHTAHGVSVTDRVGRVLKELPGVERTPIVGVSFSKDDDLMAIRQMHGAIRVFDMQNWNEVAILPSSRGSIFTFSPDDNHLLLAAAEDGVIRAWSVNRDDAPDPIFDHSEAVSNLKFSPDGRILAVGMSHGAVKFWDVRSRRHLFTIPSDRNDDPWLDHYNTYRFDFVAFAPDSRHVAVIGPREFVSVWDVLRQESLGRLPDSDELPSETRRAYWSVEFSRDGDRLYAGLCVGETGEGGVIREWEKVPGSGMTFRRRSQRHTVRSWHRSMATSPNEQFLATTSLTHFDRGSTTTIWRLPDMTVQEQLFLPIADSKMLNLSFCPTGKRLAITTAPAAVTIWDLTTWEQTASLPHSRPPEHVSWSPDGRRLASSDASSTTKLWHLETKHHQVVTTFRGSVATFSPDGNFLAVGYNGSKDDGDAVIAGRVTLHYAPPLEEIDRRLATQSR